MVGSLAVGPFSAAASKISRKDFSHPWMQPTRAFSFSQAQA
jgi:hypothetical protein